MCMTTTDHTKPTKKTFVRCTDHEIIQHNSLYAEAHLRLLVEKAKDYHTGQDVHPIKTQICQ